MGIFLKTSCQIQNASTEDKNKKIIKAINYINHNLRNNEWQESIAGQLREMDEQYHHITIFIVLRLFHIKNIEEGKLKSLYRYAKKDDRLIIDQMFVLDNLVHLPEDVMRIKLCDELFEFIVKVLIKYKNRFKDFDAIAFIPLLKERIEEIKATKLVIE